jgi:hypothetical protein
LANGIVLFESAILLAEYRMVLGYFCEIVASFLGRFGHEDGAQIGRLKTKKVIFLPTLL